MLQTPKMVLQRMDTGEIPSLDCDCMTALVLSLARSIGFPTAIRVISTRPDGVFGHVYGMVSARLGANRVPYWMPVDLVRYDKGFGWEYPAATRVLTKIVK